jgi:hypothetical protein
VIEGVSAPLLGAGGGREREHRQSGDAENENLSDRPHRLPARGTPGGRGNRSALEPKSQDTLALRRVWDQSIPEASGRARSSS